MNKRNRTISIFNTKYKLKFVDFIPTDSDLFCFGECRSKVTTVLVATKGADGKPLDDDTIEHNLLHELIHAILIEGQYLRISDDEPLVEWLARCLKHLIDQKVIGSK